MTTLIENVPTDDVSTPNRDEKLHPEENDNGEDWEDFKQSVGTDPIYPPAVKENGDGYEVVVGDRRMRAMEENGAEAVDLMLLGDDEGVDEKTMYITRLAENHHRKGSDPKKKAWSTAQVVAPWLLPPAERNHDVERMTQSNFADEVGAAQSGTVSNWLNPLRSERPLRNVLGKKASGRRLSDDDIETIDNIVGLLNGQQGHKVIATGEDGWVADKLESMSDVSLGEIEMMAGEAVDEGWTADTFLDETKSAYDAVETTATASSMSSGPLGGEDPFADNSPTQTRDEGTDAGPAGEKTNDNDEDDGPSGPNFDVSRETPDVDWDEHLKDEMFVDTETTTRDMKVRKYQDLPPAEDDAAIMLNVLAEVTGQDEMEIARAIMNEAIIEEGMAFLNEHFAYE